MNDIEVMTEVLELLDQIKGDINPERGYADELENDIQAMYEKVAGTIEAAQEQVVAWIGFDCADDGIVPATTSAVIADNWRTHLGYSMTPVFKHALPPQSVAVPEGWKLVPIALLKELEGADSYFDKRGEYQACCPVCGRDNGTTHEADCKLGVVLAAAPEVQQP